MLDFVRSYLKNVPGNSDELGDNKYCCTGCFYAIEIYMKHNFKSESANSVKEEIESIHKCFMLKEDSSIGFI